MRYFSIILLFAFWVDTPVAQISEDISSPGNQCGESSIHTYTVKTGDSLVEIGNRFGSTLFWEAIYVANADLIETPELIYPGQQLEIPK